MSTDSRGMELARAHRSPIESTVYNEALHTLTVVFSHGKTYRYDGVPAHLNAALLRAEHKGAFLVKHIKPRYKATLLNDGGVL